MSHSPCLTPSVLSVSVLCPVTPQRHGQVLPPETRTRPSSTTVTHKLSSAGLPKMLYTKSKNLCESPPSAHIERPDARARRRRSSPRQYSLYNGSTAWIIMTPVFPGDFAANPLYSFEIHFFKCPTFFRDKIEHLLL